MKAHFVTFNSPGTLFSEQTEMLIDSWDVNAAVEMSKGITERYNAKPYAFFFTTRSRGERDLDSKEIKRSGQYFLGGRTLTLKEVKAEMPDERILIGNMEGNKWKKVVISENGWRSCHPLMDGDVVLP